MRNNYTVIKRVNSSTRLKATNNWTGVSLDWCSTRQTTWPASWRSSTGTGNSSPRSFQNRLFSRFVICSAVASAFTFSAALKQQMTSKTKSCSNLSQSFSIRTRCSSFQLTNFSRKDTCKNCWPRCYKSFHLWHLSILNFTTFWLRKTLVLDKTTKCLSEATGSTTITRRNQSRSWRRTFRVSIR